MTDIICLYCRSSLSYLCRNRRDWCCPLIMWVRQKGAKILTFTRREVTDIICLYCRSSLSYLCRKDYISHFSSSKNKRVFSPFWLNHMSRGQHHSLLFQHRYESLLTCKEVISITPKRVFSPFCLNHMIRGQHQSFLFQQI
jgi:5-methylcytosine-specific restriction endonuclease McrA